MNLGIVSPKLSRIMPLAFNYFWILPFCMGAMISVVETDQSTSFAWNRNNPMFVPKVGAKLSVPLRSNFDIICPSNTTPLEYYIVYWVSEIGFTDCFKPGNASKLLVNCSKPASSILNTFTTNIVPFTGTPGGQDFTAGQSYYIATFSSGTQNGLRNERGGACEDYSMKLNLTVTDFVIHTTPGPSTNTSTTTKRTGTPTRTPRTTRSSSRRPSTESTTIESTTPRHTTPQPHTTDIPVYTDIPVITVPDSGNGNIGVIDISSGTHTSPASWSLMLSLSLSIVHILYYIRNDVHR